MSEDFEKKLFDKLDKIDSRLSNLERGQEEIKDMFRDLEATNADRHRILFNSVEELKQDIGTIEGVTAKNWKDITELKKAK